MQDFLPINGTELANAKNFAQWETTLKEYAAPFIGKKAIETITVHDIHTVLEPIWTAKYDTASKLLGSAPIDLK